MRGMVHGVDEILKRVRSMSWDLLGGRGDVAVIGRGHVSAPKGQISVAALLL